MKVSLDPRNKPINLIEGDASKLLQIQYLPLTLMRGLFPDLPKMAIYRTN